MPFRGNEQARAVGRFKFSGMKRKVIIRVSGPSPVAPVRPMVLFTGTQRLLKTRGLFLFPDVCPNPIVQLPARVTAANLAPTSDGAPGWRSWSVCGSSICPTHEGQAGMAATDADFLPEDAESGIRSPYPRSLICSARTAVCRAGSIANSFCNISWSLLKLLRPAGRSPASAAGAEFGIGSGAAAQEADAIFAVNLAHCQIVPTLLAMQFTVRVDTC